MLTKSGSRPKVLMIEDEPAYTYMFQMLLEKEEFEVLIANTAQEAFKIARSKPDIILLDLILPDIDGITVLEQMLADKDIQDIPIIVISQRTDVEDVRVCLEKGAVDYLRKPVDEIEFLARVRSVLRLKAREDELRQLVNLKDRIIRIISHDIRNPLGAIRGLTDMMLLMESLPEKVVKYLTSIKNASSMAIEYTNKMLNMAYLESERFQLDIQKHTLSEIIEEILCMFRPSMQDKHLKLIVEVPENIEIEADKVMFEQVLSNIIGNAVKFTNPEGSIFITASQQEGFVNLSIKDTGIGIEEDKLEKIFTEFYSLESGTAGETGMGMGLSISKKILDVHRFAIKVFSKKEEGTEFIISIPVA